MPEADFKPYKKDVATQRKIMRKYFPPFFKEAIIKYAKKTPSLKPVAEELIKDMELFLIQKKDSWGNVSDTEHKTIMI